MGDLITRIKDTNAFIDSNLKMYSIKELNKYLKKMQQGYDLTINDKKCGNIKGEPKRKKDSQIFPFWH